MTIYMNDGSDQILEKAGMGQMTSVFEDEAIFEFTGPLPIRIGMNRTELVTAIGTMSNALSLLIK